MDISYFAWVRERIGLDRERVDPPEEIATIVELVGWLARRSHGHADALADPTRLRAALDDRLVPLDASIRGAREVALFPPVTGG